jgi:hypothetical protein
MPGPASNASRAPQGSLQRLFLGLLASAAVLAGCGGSGGSTIPPLVNVCEQAFSPDFFASIGLRRQGDRRSGTLGPNSLLEFYFDAAGNILDARTTPPPPGTFTFYSDAFLYFPSAANVTGVTIRLTSPVFDPLLVIGSFDSNRRLDPDVFVNDDAAPGNFTTSQLTIPVRQNRCYLLQVQSYWAQNASPAAGPGSPGRGPYTIEVVSESFAAPPPPPQRQQKPDDREDGGGGDRGGGVGI